MFDRETSSWISSLPPTLRGTAGAIPPAGGPKIVSIQEQLGFAYAMGAWSRALDEDASLVERKVAIVRDGLADQLPEATLAPWPGIAKPV